MDSNHRRHKPADLQSAPFGHSGIRPFPNFHRLFLSRQATHFRNRVQSYAFFHHHPNFSTTFFNIFFTQNSAPTPSIHTILYSSIFYYQILIIDIITLFLPIRKKSRRVTHIWENGGKFLSKRFIFHQNSSPSGLRAESLNLYKSRFLSSGSSSTSDESSQ